MYADIEQDRVSVKGEAVSKKCTFLAGGNNFAKHPF